MTKVEARAAKTAYQKRWLQERPGYMRQYTRELIERLKLEAIIAAGGRCLDCGYSDISHPEVFDFDHRDPASKHPRLRHSRRGTGIALIMLPESLREAELAKCDLLCAICHRIRTKRQARAEEN